MNTPNTHVSVHTPEATLNQSSNPLVQAVGSIRQGEVPHNAQLQQTIATTQAALNDARNEQGLSSKGQVLVEDVRQVLDSAARMINEKNSDEKFQRLVGDAALAGRDTAHGVNASGVSMGRGEANSLRGHGRGAFNNGKSVALFAVRSAQFRDLIVQLLEVFQSVIRTAQNKVSQQPNNNLGGVANQLANEQVVDEQQKQALFDQVRRVLTELGRRPEYYTALDHVFAIVDHMSKKSQQVVHQTASQSSVPTAQYDQVWSDTKIVIEEFSGVGTADELERRNWILFNQVRSDPEARSFFKEFRAFILDTVQNPASLDDPRRRDYGSNLMDRARILFQGKYRPYFQDVFDSITLILNNIKNDASTQDFSHKLSKLGADFAFDSNGRPDLFVIQESLSQMRTILVPVISKHLSNVPIPRVEGSNPKYDFAVEGMILHVNDLLPDFINLRTKTNSKLNTHKLNSGGQSIKVIMEVERVRALFRDVKFFYRRKRVPKIEDHGVADVDLSQGTGLSIKIVWKLKSSANRPLVVRLLKVKCNIDRLAITVKSAKHNILDKLATKLFAGTIKKQIANAIVNNIISALQPMSTKLNELFKRKPLTAVVERANEGMKNAMTGDHSIINKAKDAISTGVETIKNQASNATTPSSTAYVTETVTVVPATTLVQEHVTFVEKDRSAYQVNKKDWAFEWYSPAPEDVVEGVAVVPASTSATLL